MAGALWATEEQMRQVGVPALDSAKPESEDGLAGLSPNREKATVLPTTRTNNLHLELIHPSSFIIHNSKSRLWPFKPPDS
jgi:hypothetical protein